MTDEPEITAAEAARVLGQIGGRATYDKHGAAHYRRLGQQGGNAWAAMSDRETRRANAKKGGDTTRAFWGREHYAEIGRRGGEATLARYGREHYAQAGRANRAPAEERPPKACERCGVVFACPPGRSGAVWASRRYCSKSCAAVARVRRRWGRGRAPA